MELKQRLPEKGSRVLVVDDEEQLVALLAERLRFCGYEVDGAYNGHEGLVKTGVFRPDAIILDILMPKMDGWEFANTLKADPVTEAIPILILTALNAHEIRDKAEQYGIRHVITKPGNEGELFEALRRLIAKN